MKRFKRGKRMESNHMDSGKYVNVLVILNAMVRRFRETLVLIKEQQESERLAHSRSDG